MESKKTNIRALMVLVGGFICVAMASGALIGTMSMYLAPVAAKLGTNAGVVGYFFTFNAICAFLASFLAAPILKRFKLTGLLTFAAIAGALCILGVAWAPSAAVICAAGFLSGICSQWASNPVLQSAIARWFMYNRGKYGAIIGLGELAGTAVFTRIAAAYIDAGHYETSCIVIAVSLLALIIFSAFVLIRGYPEDYGMKPVGYEKYQAEVKSKELETEETPGLTKAEIFKKPSFWIFLLANFFMVFACCTYSGQQATIYLERGMTTAQAATLVSVYAAAKAINKLVYGVVADRFGVLIGSMYTIILTVVGLVIFLTAGSYSVLLIGAILVGSGQGLAGISGTLGLSKLIGQKSIADLGILPHGAAALGGVLGPTFFSIIYSTTGRVDAGIILGLSVWIVTAVFVIISLRRKNLVELDGGK